MTITIEKNIPVSPEKKKYPFEGMEVGDSFLVPEYSILRSKSVYSSIYNFQKKNKKKKFVLRKEKDNIRVWRIK